MNITLSPQVTYKQMDKEALLLDHMGEPYYELDEVGARLWQLLSANDDFDAAVTQLLKEYPKEFGANVEEAEEELRRELFELLEDMAQADLVAWE